MDNQIITAEEVTKRYEEAMKVASDGEGVLVDELMEALFNAWLDRQKKD